MSEQILQHLKKAITPFFDDFNFIYDETLVESITPAPDNIPFLLKNEPFTLYIFFNKNVSTIENLNTKISLKCLDSTSSKILKFEVHINSQTVLINNNVYKLGVSKILN